MNLNEQVLELKNDWEMNERWAYVKDLIQLKKLLS